MEMLRQQKRRKNITPGGFMQAGYSAMFSFLVLGIMFHDATTAAALQIQPWDQHRHTWPN